MGHQALLGGRYRLVERLGRGGMSVVWRGWDEVLGRPVAVKVLDARLAGDAAFRDRLRQEALAAARLCHPHVTGVYDAGESPVSARLTVPYVVMELHDGESVADRLGRGGPLPWREAVLAAAETAAALATAHARGVVHRDVTPANVMLTAAGAKVVDFGISALVGQCDAGPDGSLLGTPAYLAPERLSGGPVSPATDVYALGLLLYRALTARLPWPAATTADALRAHLYAAPAPVPDLPGMPAEVGELCLRCLAKHPGDRPGAAELARRLGALVGWTAVVADAPPVPAPGAATVPPAGWPVPRHAPAAGPGRVRGVRGVPLRAVLARGVPFRAALGYLGLPGGTAGPRPPVGGAAGPVGGAAGPPVGDDAGPPVAGGPGPVVAPRGRAGSRRWAGVRLRAGLRLARALHAGAPVPLGGGVFAGGRFTRDVLTGAALLRAAFGRRHRAPAVAVTVALAVLAAVGLAGAREPGEPGEAQAAAAGAAAPGPRLAARAPCTVRYRVVRDSGTAFEAVVTVTNRASRALPRWRLGFAYPGAQRLAADPAVVQRGHSVYVTPGTRLGAGRSASVTLRGSYRAGNPLPLVFLLDGRPCRVELYGPTAPPGRHGAGEQAIGVVRSAPEGT